VTNERISFSSPLPTVLSIDGTSRVRDFLARHGGPAPDVEHEADCDDGAAGWSEVHAADGYRLRCEWSLVGSERRMSFAEIHPPAMADKRVRELEKTNSGAAPPPYRMAERQFRDDLIRKAAYRRFELRRPCVEHQTADWLAAEAEVDAMLTFHPRSQ
jgi:hypothetical protein